MIFVDGSLGVVYTPKPQYSADGLKTILELIGVSSVKSREVNTSSEIEKKPISNSKILVFRKKVK